MTTVLFVHGTGVRRSKYERDFQHVERKLQNRLPTLKIEPCLWGDAVGAKLHLQGLSIPHYDVTGGQVTSEELEIELWGHLYADPLFELRVFAIRSGAKRSMIGGVTLGDELDDMVRDLENLQKFPQLHMKLRKAEIDQVFEQARITVRESIPYREMRQTVSSPMGTYQTAIARAIIAESIALASRQQPEVILLYDAILRDELVHLVEVALGYTSTAMGPGEWIVAKLLGTGRAIIGRGMATLGTPLIEWRRGAITDATSANAGDILVYQAHGEDIRRYIQMRIDEIEPPVVLLAHSLGGVACVDLLIENDLRERVKLLITVGSQAPYFYEIGALHSLPFDQGLPEHFPDDWVNLYDLSDFLSYIGANVFPKKVQDIPVKSRQPFPQSHGAYWTNPTTWKTIVHAIQTRVR